MPDGRKLHTRPVPRIGGLAHALAFISALILLSFVDTKVTDLLQHGEKEIQIIIGLPFAFLTRFIDY